MIKKEIHEENVDILEVQQELIEEEEEKNGAFFCEYGTFKVNVCNTVKNDWTSGHLCLITLQDHSKFESDKEKE